MNLDIEQVKARLLQLGYAAKEGDDGAIGWALDKAAAYIRNECNTDDVPEGLTYALVDMAVGEFLQMKKTFAPDDLADFDLSGAVQQITEGDASVSFASGDGAQTDEQRLDAFINYLISYATPQFSCFRRLRW